MPPLTRRRVHIRGLGIISPLGQGLDPTIAALRSNLHAIRPLQLFTPARATPLPVGEVSAKLDPGPLPRCHQLACIAAGEAMAGNPPPDAVIVGITTGGILTTEHLLQARNTDPARYQYHSLASVAEELARRYQCPGPALTISTACSSGTTAIIIALEMIRTGQADRVLVGGVDSLCRLTYFGFHSLQLVDAEGARPFDANRKGMSVAEGAAMLLLEADQPERAVAEILGGGLSCDAYHPAAPHPQGLGAQKAMAAALADAGLKAADIDYINLHGTGTPDNDQAEARAVHALFPHHPPPLSSIKGATGHALGAAGAIEAVVAAIAVSMGFIPANTGCREPDPTLGLKPLASPMDRPIQAVLSNSFGFGGNNASLVIASPARFAQSRVPVNQRRPLSIINSACCTGAGATDQTMARLAMGQAVAGLFPIEEISKELPPRLVRRLKRLPRLALALTDAARPTNPTAPPASVFMGTGWGALSETHDFLDRLFATEEQFPSPTDFVGSVHNGPASQVAIHFQATGPNITTSAGNYSFEQALMAAALVAPTGEQPFFVLAADEYHPQLSPLLDPAPGFSPADGGGALCLRRNPTAAELTISSTFYRRDDGNGQVIAALIQEALGGAQALRAEYGLLLAGLPASCRGRASEQLNRFLAQSGFTAPVIDYRRLTGEFASASAVAVVMAVNWLQQGHIPETLAGSGHAAITPKKALIIGFGPFVTAMEITAP